MKKILCILLTVCISIILLSFPANADSFNITWLDSGLIVGDLPLWHSDSGEFVLVMDTSKQRDDHLPSYGYTDENGKIVIPTDYQATSGFSEGLVGLGKADKDGNIKYGFLNEKAETIIPFIYDYAGQFSDGIAPIGKLDGKSDNRILKFGLIDAEGNIVLSPQFDNITNFSDGMAVISLRDGYNAKYGYINSGGSIVAGPIYDYASDFSDGLGLVAKLENGRFKYGYIDKTGKEIIPLMYDADYDPDTGYSSIMDASFKNGLARISMSDADGSAIYGFIDKSGKTKVSLKYAYVSASGFSENMIVAAVVNDMGVKYGYVDQNGKETVSFIYDGASDFSEGIAFVRKSDNEYNCKYAYIDKTGRELTPFKYNMAQPLRNGYAIATTGNGYDGCDHCYVIDKNGKEVAEIECSKLGYTLNSDFMYIVKDGKIGIFKHPGVSGKLNAAVADEPDNDKTSVEDNEKSDVKEADNTTSVEDNVKSDIKETADNTSKIDVTPSSENIVSVSKNSDNSLLVIIIIIGAALFVIGLVIAVILKRNKSAAAYSPREDTAYTKPPVSAATAAEIKTRETVPASTEIVKEISKDEWMFCPACGCELPSDSEFCIKCGHSLMK